MNRTRPGGAARRPPAAPAARPALPGGAAQPEYAALLPLLLCALLLLPAACGPDAPPARLAPLPAGAVVLAFGDSLTYGTGAGGYDPQPGASYPEVLARETGLAVVRSGVPGETTERGLARLPGVLAQARPALVILEHGGNDFLRGLPEAQTEANLVAMVRACREAHAQVLLLGAPRPGLRLALHPVYPRVVQQTGAILEPDLLPALLGDGALKSDPLHFNAAGYARLALGVAAALRRLGALPPRE
jgi:lysophospholipase L1-like esterase